MKPSEIIDHLTNKYEILSRVDLTPWFDMQIHLQTPWLLKQILPLHRARFESNQRLIFTALPDTKHSTHVIRDFLIDFQRQINEVDISNFFVVLVTNFDDVDPLLEHVAHDVSTDPVRFSHEYSTPIHDYNSTRPVKISWQQLHDREKFLLTESKTFCMYPWVHLHAYPTGDAYPCCMSEMDYPVGNARQQSLKEIWNGEPMRRLRLDMLAERPLKACAMCYEKELSGFFSGRQSANKHHGHHVGRVAKTADDGTFDEFQMVYWDIRFSNLCNLKCRSCGHIFSSQWYQDQAHIAGPDWKKTHQVLNYAGRTETDIWEQLLPHLDYVEQIYFAGGEPLLMQEHYNILEELEKRKKFNVRLIYNTNFTHTQLKSRSVFDYWRRFESVSVGASLDASGARAEYIRSGTVWSQVVENRKRMIKICPQVDFYISPTLSILNAWHITDFHRDWVNQELIKPQDVNVNVLQDPRHYRIDIAPASYKEKLEEKFLSHLDWLKPLDHLNRASNGYESAIKFMNSNDNSDLIPLFKEKTMQLDKLRNESLLDVIPELAAVL